MINRFLATVLALICITSVLSGCGSRGSVYVFQYDVTVERLNEMIESGKTFKDRTTLILPDNQISDSDLMLLVPLIPHTVANGNAYGLDLGSNQISDITPLSLLTNVYSLDLGSNQISNITPLALLTNLKLLYLGDNPITQEQVDKLQGVLSDCQIMWE